jgi:hypothetical protein
MEEGEIGEEEEEFEISGDRKHQLASTICGRFSARKAPKFGRPDKKMRRKGKGKGGIVKKKKRVASGKASQQGKAHEKRRLGR